MSVSPKYNHHSPELSRTHTQRRKQTNVKGKKKYSTKYLNTLFIRRPNKRHLNYLTIIYWGSKGWRSGESARLPQMWPGFKSWRGRHMWIEFVVGSLLCSEKFFSRYSGFLFSSKSYTSKFQFNQESGRRRTTLWMCYLQIIIY